jgi:UDP-2-acetamido-3-amino-2,3-dideoxy-glucuronate N-acetyltransferase
VNKEEKKDLALVGVGRWGKNHARTLKEIGVLHTLCDTKEPILDEYQEEDSSLLVTTNFKHVLENQEIDKVVIASPAILHFEMVKQALLADKHVFVEKPLCLSLKEGEELIKLAKQKQKILMVGHLLHYHPAVQALFSLLEEEMLGKVQYVISNRLNLGPVRKEENALWNFAPHDISLILRLFEGKLPLEVRSFGGAYMSKEVEDLVLTTLSFEEGRKAHVYVSWLHPFKEQKLIVIGSKGMAVFDDTEVWDKKLAVYKEPFVWDGVTIPSVKASEPSYISIEKKEPLKEELLHFCIACKTNQAPLTDGEEGLKVLRVLQAAENSLKNHGEAMSLTEKFSDTEAKGVKKSSFFAHETAIIDPKAKIGQGSKIWHFSHIMRDAVMGKRCNIGQNVVVSPQVILGDNCKVQNNVSLYEGVICEEDVFLGPSMVFTNIKNPRAAFPRKDCYTNTMVRTGATIGANATILTGIELGAHCFIGAGAVVTKNVKPYALILGNPGVQVGWMSKAGLRLDLPLQVDEDEEIEAQCKETEEVYLLRGDQVFLKEDLSSSKGEGGRVKVPVKR